MFHLGVFWEVGEWVYFFTLLGHVSAILEISCFP